MDLDTKRSPNIQPLKEEYNKLIPPSERYRFIPLFAFLTGLSFFIGLEFATSQYNPISITLTGFDKGLPLGMILGTTQWVFLRKYLFDKMWIIVTAIGFGISMHLASWLALNFVAGASGSVFVILWLGFASQWIVLRRYVKRSWVWLFLSLFSALLIAILWAILVPSPFIINGIGVLIVKRSQSLILGVTFALGLCIFDRKIVTT